MKKQLWVVPVLAILFSSCLKQELAVPRKDRGPVKTAIAEMGENYDWQVYYDLRTNTVAGKNLKTDWDLAFATGSNDFAVMLNSANYMLAYNTGKTDFAAVSIKDTTGNGPLWDNPGGYLDSTAIGSLSENNHVYILDRGVDLSGKAMGFVKIAFSITGENSYRVRYADVSGADETTVEIKKDSLYNFSFLSFAKKEQVLIQPPKKDFDLVFTQYVHVYVDINTPYRVTGCLLNNYLAMAALDTTMKFEEITAANIKSYTLSSAVNTIGYNWKDYSLSESIYKVMPGMNYIVKGRDGVYYKMRFIRFTQQKVKGYPQWEYQEL